jgi:NAD+ diphosphatase
MTQQQNAFTGARLDRAGDGRRRDADWLDAQAAHPGARALVADEAGIALDGGARLTRRALAEVETDGGPRLLLGLDDEGPLFAVDALANGASDGAARPPMVAGVREAVGDLEPAEGGLLAYAASLLNWHRTHRFCANCGAPTDVGEGGLVRACPACGTEHHPRTDPVAITLVVDGHDRAVLGRQGVWPAGRFSALAGFVEPGESLEEAVAREILEEACVQVGRPVFVSSQPWPFPASLMVGFLAPWEAGEPRPGDAEIEDVRWFSREAIQAAAVHDAVSWLDPLVQPDLELLLPPWMSIARRLVEHWLAQAPGGDSAGGG